MNPAPGILIVDDSPTTGYMMKYYLDALGYRTADLVETSDAALTAVVEKRPDLVLMDINLGEGMDGIETADIIMQRFQVPVIYVTAYSDPVTLERARRSMPFGFINKPFRDNDLKVNIELALARRESALASHSPLYGVQDSAGLDAGMPDNALLSLALDQLVSGVVALDPALRIHYQNAAAEKIFRRIGPLKNRLGKLYCVNPNLAVRVKQMMEEGCTQVLTVDHHLNSVYLIIVPAPGQEQTDGDRRRFLMFLFTTDYDRSNLEDVIRTVHGLSPTEAKIAARLVFNPYLAEIASGLGITYNTARTHLKRIYQKTGTRKLPALVRKIISGPAGLLLMRGD